MKPDPNAVLTLGNVIGLVLSDLADHAAAVVRKAAALLAVVKIGATK